MLSQTIFDHKLECSRHTPTNIVLHYPLGSRNHLDHLVYGPVEESPGDHKPRKADDPVNFLLLALLHTVKIPFKTSRIRIVIRSSTKME